MKYVNLTIATVRSPEVLGCEPVARATWFMVMAYCCDQENGGRLAGAANWKDRQWQQTCAVTKQEVEEAEPLLTIDGEDVVVWAYPTHAEEANRKLREGGGDAGRKSGEARRAKREKQTEPPPSTPDLPNRPVEPDGEPAGSRNANAPVEHKEGRMEGRERGNEGSIPLSPPGGGPESTVDSRPTLPESRARTEASAGAFEKKNSPAGSPPLPSDEKKGGPDVISEKRAAGGVEPGSVEAFEATRARICAIMDRPSGKLSPRGENGLREVMSALPLGEVQWAALARMREARKNTPGKPKDLRLCVREMESADALAENLLEAAERAVAWVRDQISTPPSAGAHTSPLKQHGLAA